MSRFVRISQTCRQLLAPTVRRSPSSRVYISHPSINICTQTRLYAAAAAPAPRPRKDRLQFYDIKDISPQEFERIVQRNQDTFQRVSPERYFECLGQFTKAIEDGSQPYSVKLNQEKGFSAAVMHETGCIVRHLARSKTSNTISIALWASASEMGYRPATMTLARHLIRAGQWGRVATLKKAEARFKQIVAEGRNPDALTIEGELLFSQGQHIAATKVLQKALSLGDAGFEWRSLCQLCLGRVYAKLGRTEEAIGVLRSLIDLDPGFVEADIELGELLRGTDREQARQHLYMAAVNNNPDIFANLSEMALEDAALATEESTREDHQRWAMEWSRLADPKAQI